jgi:hypothetical protein
MNRLREDIMQRRCSYLSYKLCKKMEQNLHETTTLFFTFSVVLHLMLLLLNDPQLYIPTTRNM